MMPNRVRLNKFLRDCGLGSRRKCEGLVLEGLVTVNGATTTDLATLVEPGADEVRVEGKAVVPRTGRLYVAVYKPRGAVVTASDPQGRDTVFEVIRGLPAGLFAVGRLDKESEGLILLTNDGKLAFRLTHPRYGIPKTYEVRLNRSMDAGGLQRLVSGIELEDGVARAGAARIVEAEPHGAVVEIVLTEGRKREIRRMLAACGYEVISLKRTRFADIGIGDMGPGDWRFLERDEVRALRRTVEQAYLDKRGA
jgi:pseudouridine synthase